MKEKKSTNITKPCIGLIVPPAAGLVPPEPVNLYGDSIDFIASGLGLKELTPSGYDGVIDRVIELSQGLADRGARGVSLMGTSLSFYRGIEFNDELIAEVEKGIGRPFTTMSTSVVQALEQVQAKRVAVASPYVREVSQRLIDFLRLKGFEVVSEAFLELKEVDRIQALESSELVALGREAVSKATQKADTLLMSCGGLRTERTTEVLEAELNIPVISSSIAGAWGAARLTGASGVSSNGPYKLMKNTV